MATREELECASAGLMRVSNFIDHRAGTNLQLLSQLMEHVQVLMAHAIKQCKRVGIKYIDDQLIDHGKPIDIVCGAAAHAMKKKEYRKAIDLLSVVTNRVTRILSLPLDGKANHIVPEWVPPAKGM